MGLLPFGLWEQRAEQLPFHLLLSLMGELFVSSGSAAPLVGAKAWAQAVIGGALACARLPLAGTLPRLP